MKILVLSDSHAGLSFMRTCVNKVKPDAIIHLGDYFDDGQTIAEENSQLPFYQVPGNCDRYRLSAYGKSEVLVEVIGGVKLYITHGHKQGVKLGLFKLLRDARDAGVQAVLYGHTHSADCHQEDDGLWVLNPGSSGSYGGSAGVIRIENGCIQKCYLLDMSDLEVL